MLRRTAAALARALGLHAGKDAPARGKVERRASKPEPAPRPVAKAPAAAPAPAPASPVEPPTPTPPPSQTETLLDYLFGGDG